MAVVRGGTVRPHVQRFADACSEATGAESFGTYPGHSPSIDLALDIFVPINSSTLGNAISTFAIENRERYGVRYVIYRQRIWHRLDPYWRAMADRGDLTQNHYDHAHISFEPTAADVEPEPEPEPPQGDLHMLTFRYIAEGVDWVFDGPSKLFFNLNDPRQITEVLDPLGVKALGKVSDATHARYSELAAAAGFAG